MQDISNEFGLTRPLIKYFLFLMLYVIIYNAVTLAVMPT